MWIFIQQKKILLEVSGTRIGERTGPKLKNHKDMEEREGRMKGSILTGQLLSSRTPTIALIYIQLLTLKGSLDFLVNFPLRGQRLAFWPLTVVSPSAESFVAVLSSIKSSTENVFPLPSLQHCFLDKFGSSCRYSV